MFENKKRGFTLIEMLIVVIIIGIFVTLSINHFAVAREHAYGGEAIIDLTMIAAAERMYKMEVPPYAFIGCDCACAGTGNFCCNNNNIGCNVRLNLDLHTDHWTYQVTVPANPPGFIVTADRIGAGGYFDCQYILTDSDPDGKPNPNASCH